MRHRLLLHTALFGLALLVPTLYNSSLAQSAWIVGNEWARMDPPSGSVSFAALPAHPTVANAYQGNLATKSSYIQLDDQGYPLFFIIDGDVFDGDGYLIAPHHITTANDPYVRDDGLLFEGTGEVAVAPVPGRCGLWYIFHSRIPFAAGHSYQELSFAVLDMRLPNALFPGSQRKGSVYDLTALLANDFQPMVNAVEGRFSLTYAGELPDTPDFDLGFPNGEVQMECVFSAATGRSFLLVHNAFHLAKYELLSDRIQPLGSQQVLFPTGAVPMVLRTKGEIEAVADGDAIRVALAFNAVVPNGPGYDWILNLFTVTLDATSSTLAQSGPSGLASFDRIVDVPFEENALGGPIAWPGVGGLEFSPNKRYTYFFKSFQNPTLPSGPTSYLGYWDWQLNELHYLPGLSMLPFVDSKMELGSAPNGSGDALYFSGTASNADPLLGCLLGPDDPATASFVQSAVAVDGGSICTDPLLYWTGVSDRYHLLPKQTFDDQSNVILTSFECCADVHAITSYTDMIIPTGSATWTATSNPFHDRQQVRITGELRFDAGAYVNASGLEFRFGEEAVLIIEEGAQFNCTNCTFTNACEGVRWNGIRVEGDATDHTQTGTHQGQLRLFSSTVEGARAGVWCTRENTNGGPGLAYGGGVVRAYGTIFRNCRVGARVDNYHRYAGNGAELPNLCYFSGCTFETTADWLPTDLPKRVHLILSDVTNIKVMDCSFKNTTPGTVTTDLNLRGYGIFARDASFTCNGTNPSTYEFEGLTAGVVASLPDPAQVYTVNGMGFTGNGQGVVDFGSTDARITNNRFVLRGSATTSNTATVGIQLFQSERYAVERNTFTDQGTNVPSVGIWFSGPAVEANRIYDNTFTSLSIGSLVEGRHRADYGVPQMDPGLEMLCGDHTGNNADQFILQEGYIQYMQGLPQSGNTTANNTFGPVDCDSNGAVDPSFNVSAWAWSDYGLDVEYNFFDNAGSPEMRPDCIEDMNGDPISNVGDWFYDLAPVTQDFPFDKATNCGSGLLDEIVGPGDVVQLTLQYKEAQGAMQSAIWQYYSNVDTREPGGIFEVGDPPVRIRGAGTRRVLQMLAMDPPYASYQLRDTLFEYSPLSDAVLVAAIENSALFDPWHLTQVLIQNSPLDSEVENALLLWEPLPTYFYNLLQEYADGENIRSVLELEVVQRQQEKTRVQHLLLDAWAADSTMAARQDSLVAIFAQDSLGDGVRGQYLTHLYRGEFTEALALDDDMEEHGYENLTIWGKLHQGVEGDWDQMSPEDRDGALGLAYDHALGVGAIAWATLVHVDELDSLPIPEIPSELKSLWMSRRYREDADGTTNLLGVLPNPANDRIAFTYPAGMENGILEMHDAQGRLVLSISLNGRKGLVESSVRDLSEGLYTTRLLLDGLNVANAKFNVMR